MIKILEGEMWMQCEEWAQIMELWTIGEAVFWNWGWCRSKQEWSG
jgi:hypothetical protein